MGGVSLRCWGELKGRKKVLNYFPFIFGSEILKTIFALAFGKTKEK
jgi:hypothetical protein